MLTQHKDNNYLSILGDGTIRMVVPQGTEGAVIREYETSDGKKGSKWELVYNSIEGKIVDAQFFEGDYGKLLQITVNDGIEPLVLSINTTQPFGEDLMKKLPRLDISKDVKLSPYAITGDNGKTTKGISVMQNGEKIKNFFYDGEKNLNGFPTPDGDVKKFMKDDWKIYFLQARKFLVKHTEENFITKFKKVEPVTTYPKNDLGPSPFDGEAEADKIFGPF